MVPPERPRKGMEIVDYEKPNNLDSLLFELQDAVWCSRGDDVTQNDLATKRVSKAKAAIGAEFAKVKARKSKLATLIQDVILIPAIMALTILNPKWHMILFWLAGIGTRYALDYLETRKAHNG